MALQTIGWMPIESAGYNIQTATTINAAGESMSAIGQVFIPGGGSKTISSSGGGIFWSTTTVTHVNSGTVQTVGIQGVNTTTNLESGTFLVSGTHTGGAANAVVQNKINTTVISGGSLSITHGDLYAVVSEMTTRGGSDFVTGSRTALTSQAQMWPVAGVDAGAGPALTNAPMACTIKFDDGTLGFIGGQPLLWPVSVAPSTVLPGSASSPDEYGAVFKFPFKCQVSAIGYQVGSMASPDSIQLTIYSDPEGTPTALASGSVLTPVGTSSSTVSYATIPIAPQTLSADTLYCIAAAATNTGTVGMGYHDLTASGAALKGAQPFSAIKFSGRTNFSGAFAEVDANYLPQVFLVISQLSDDAGGAPPASSGAPFQGAGFIVG